MKKLNLVWLGLGTNLGDRRRNLVTAAGLIYLKVGPLHEVSGIYKTAAWGVTEQPDFLNQAVCARTVLNPAAVLREINEIENFMGRVRDQKWGPRLIDIDILYFENEIIDETNLKIPHPRIQERNFVLIPLSEIAPDFVHPVFNLSNRELLHRSKDTAEVTPFLSE